MPTESDLQRREASRNVQVAAPPAAAAARLVPAVAPSIEFSEDDSYSEYSDASSTSTFTEFMRRYTISCSPEYSVKLRKGYVILKSGRDGAHL